jgi:hypothetical protein
MILPSLGFSDGLCVEETFLVEWPAVGRPFLFRVVL